MENPSLVIRLGSGGGIEVELPGPDDRPRLLPVFDIDDLIAILEGKLADTSGIGEAGAPTAQLVWHQAKHQIFPNEKCPFCRRAEARLSSARESRKSTFRAVGDGSVVVRHIPLGKKALADASDAPLARQECPANLSRAELQLWHQREERRVANEIDKKLRKQGITKVLLAKDLGL